jgi:hypothetical protein
MPTGTFVRVCHDVTVQAGGSTSCDLQTWQEVDPALLTTTATMTADDYTAIFNGVMYLVILVFIFGMIKKAIEQ